MAIGHPEFVGRVKQRPDMGSSYEYVE